MPPSPSSSMSSLAARFAFKPAEAGKAAAAIVNSDATGTRTAKRRLSSSSKAEADESQSPMPTRSTPRCSATPTSVTDVKGKGKEGTAATTSTSTSVDLRDDNTDLNWEIADEDIAAIADEALVSKSNKKIKLEDMHASGPSVAAASTSRASTVKPHSGQSAIKAIGTETAAPNSSLSSESLNDTAREFLEGLSDSQIAGTGGMLSHRQLLELESRTMDPSWLIELRKEMKKPYFLDLKRFLWNEGVRSAPEISRNIFPPAGEIYSWSRFTPLDKVRVVILGQDPYHNIGQAHGLAFSVRSNVAVPPSLRNIYKEVKNDYPDFQIPKHGYLGSWARQGVLMLNTSLTVRAHQANSHSGKGWEQFTDSILKVITSRPGPGVVFFAWGSPAQKRTANIITSTTSSAAAAQSLFAKKKPNAEGNGKSDKEDGGTVGGSKHLILKSVHPSPLSANRGFFGNSHFKKANEWLRERYGEQGMIDWCTVDPEEPKA